MGHKVVSVLGKVLRRLDDLANEEYEERTGHTESWRAIDGLSHSDAIGDQLELWSLREDQTKKTLASLSIDPENYEYDLKTTQPSVLCLIELWKMFKAHEPILKSPGAAMWLYCTENSLPDIDRLAVAWGYRQAEARKRAKTAEAGAEAKAKSQRAIIAEAIQRFDPGNESGLSDSRRAEMILSRAHAAKAKGEFAEADRLPKSLRRHLR